MSASASIALAPELGMKMRRVAQKALHASDFATVQMQWCPAATSLALSLEWLEKT